MAAEFSIMYILTHKDNESGLCMFLFPFVGSVYFVINL